MNDLKATPKQAFHQCFAGYDEYRYTCIIISDEDYFQWNNMNREE